MGRKLSLASMVQLPVVQEKLRKSRWALNGLMPPKCPMPLSKLDSPVITLDTVCTLVLLSWNYFWCMLLAQPLFRTGLLKGTEYPTENLQNWEWVFKVSGTHFLFREKYPCLRNVYSAQWNLPHALMDSILSLFMVFQSICWENWGMSWFYIQHDTMQDLEACMSVWTQASVHVESIYLVAWENL